MKREHGRKRGQLKPLRERDQLLGCGFTRIVLLRAKRKLLLRGREHTVLHLMLHLGRNAAEELLAGTRRAGAHSRRKVAGPEDGSEFLLLVLLDSCYNLPMIWPLGAPTA